MNEEEYERDLERIFEFIGVSVVPGSKEDEEMTKLCERVQAYQESQAEKYAKEMELGEQENSEDRIN